MTNRRNEFLKRSRYLAFAAALLTAGLAEGQELTPAERLEVVFASTKTEGNIKIIDPIFRQTGQFMLLQVQAVNEQSKRVAYEYKVDWFDRDGVQVQTISAWQTLFLGADQQQTIQSMGQKTSAYKARVTIRRVAK